MSKLKNYLPKNAKEVTIHLGWDCGDGSNAGYTANLYIDTDNWPERTHNESIILDDDYNDLDLTQAVEYFATEYLPAEYHDLNQWKIEPEIAACQIPIGYFLDEEPPKESPKIRTQVVKPGTAREIGFGSFNFGDHLCVDVPDGHSTISVKLSDGRQITFAFVPYQEGGVPKCVDIRDLGDPIGTALTGTEHYRQNVIGFSGARNAFVSVDEKRPCTLLSLLFKEGETNE